MRQVASSDFIVRLNPSLLALAKRTDDIAVLVAMFTFSDNGRGQCFASHRSIAKVAHTSDKTVPISIDRMGVFEKTGEKSIRGGTVNIYEVRKQYALYLSVPPKVRNSDALNNESAEMGNTSLNLKCGNETPNTIETLIREEEFQKISISKKVKLEDVKRTAEKLKDYCEANGKSYKSYPAALRNWVQTEIERGTIKQVKSFEEQAREENPDIKII